MPNETREQELDGALALADEVLAEQVEPNVVVMGPRRYRVLLDGTGTAEEIAFDVARIVAAPEMYDALRSLVDGKHLKTCGHLRRADRSCSPECLQVLTALAKADGKAP